MTASLTISARSLRERAIDLLWQQWSCLGIPGYGTSPSVFAIDPEALVLATCSLGRHDARLFDEALGWLASYGHLISVQRLKTLVRDQGFAGGPVLGGVAAFLHAQDKSAKWRSLIPSESSLSVIEPLFLEADGTPLPSFGETEPAFALAGFHRGPVRLRDHGQPFDATHPACFTLKLRALFGTNVRADALSYLIAEPSSANASAIARRIGYFQKSVHDALSTMAASGLLRALVRPGETLYSPLPALRDGLLAGTRQAPDWLAWWRVWRSLEILLHSLSEDAFALLQPALQASILRDQLSPLVHADGQDTFTDAFQPVLAQRGDAFADALNAAIDTVFAQLRPDA